MSDEIFETIVYQATEEEPRHSEASILPLSDGRLLLVWSRFYTGGLDHSPADISGKISQDGGRTWGERFVLQPNDGKQNVMSPSLRCLRSGAILFFYLRKNSDSDLHLLVRHSTDEGQTWGDEITVDALPGYWGMCNDRGIQLRSGRILAPVYGCADIEKPEQPLRTIVWFSDDDGRSWQPSGQFVDVPKRGAMEPDVVELKDGRVMMIIRNQFEHPSVCYSSDGGETWTEPEWLSVTGPEAPARIERIPTTGDLLLVWNHSYQEGAGHSGIRRPLSTAISRDEGETWESIRDLETEPPNTYAYPSVVFVEDRALFSYYVSPQLIRGASLKVKSVPISWLYGR